MKHPLKVTFLLFFLFLIAQVIGLGIIRSYLSVETVIVGNQTVVMQTWKELPYHVERPDFAEETSYIPLFLIILLATVIVLILFKLKAFRLWKFWFFLSVWFCLVIAFKVFFGEAIALALGFVLAFLKVVRKNMTIHNITELFLYGGLASVFVPVLSVWSATVLLVLVAIYDAIAVWKTKHMVHLAQVQTKLKLFSGLMVPYGKSKFAVLGGGDIGFPLFFAGAALKTFGWMSLVVVLCSSLSLLGLLLYARKNTFYPAMPFLAGGCLLGYLLLLL